ncbi:unnamed protein product [Tenebrio molitor]|nr:unnamed protein product [Tenebrio molitor]
MIDKKKIKLEFHIWGLSPTWLETNFKYIFDSFKSRRPWWF